MCAKMDAITIPQFDWLMAIKETFKSLFPRIPHTLSPI